MFPTACSNCRKRKVKCTGSHPCNNCIKRSEKCDYKKGPVKRSPTLTRVSNKQFLTVIAQKFDNLQKSLKNIETLLLKNGNNKVDRTFNTSAPPHVNSSNKKIIDSGINTVAFYLYCTGGTEKYLSEMKTSFKIFTKYGFEWIRKQVDSQEAQLILNDIMTLNKKLREDNARLVHKAYKTNNRQIFHLKPPEYIIIQLHKIYTETIKNYVCTLYFTNMDDLILNKYMSNHDDELTDCELFLIYSVLLLSSSLRSIPYKHHEYKVWKTFYFLQTVSYYQKITNKYTMNIGDLDPIQILQAISVFCYFLTNSPTPQITCFICSTAISICNDIGLNKQKFFYYKSDVETRLKCRFLYLFFYQLDGFLALLIGKPQLIPVEYTEIIQDDFLNDLCVYHAIPFKDADFSNIGNFYKRLETSYFGFRIILFHMNSGLQQLCGVVYREFASTKSVETYKLFDKESHILSINEKLDNWCLLLPEILRPNNSGYKNLEDHLLNLNGADSIINIKYFKQSALLLLLHYHVIRLWMNKMVLGPPWETSNDNYHGKQTLLKRNEYLNRVIKNSVCVLKIIEIFFDDVDWNPTHTNTLSFSFFSSFLILFSYILSKNSYPLEDGNCGGDNDIKKLTLQLTIYLQKYLDQHNRNIPIDVSRWCTSGIHMLYFLKILFIKYQKETGDTSFIFENYFPNDIPQLRKTIQRYSKENANLFETSYPPGGDKQHSKPATTLKEHNDLGNNKFDSSLIFQDNSNCNGDVTMINDNPQNTVIQDPSVAIINNNNLVTSPSTQLRQPFDDFYVDYLFGGTNIDDTNLFGSEEMLKTLNEFSILDEDFFPNT
ncbi:uncharacterized protein SCODWIG_00919 [Saccharomycodes ludwigii]|uniref:Zn(2)-C6 fungal-type domain-containing protein n=1 Tax=Saccharomycodes ludwigii TaxID=36035 RepID=A0A376B392_9ASCO|nr:hypothetical protein SCDLUD_000829 [Saccharomycodes ludwigii]KAH3903210.1 hypothetical protein SCDLUD_000829 [Saccharomycodes ludwigii]SSD59158.1 uncharacterized protein SCODWIG_00919 [Saccharomycodes ludwigii]